MARLVFEQANIYTGSVGGTLIGEISNVLTDDLTIDKEGNVVTVDNGRELNESFQGTIELRTRNQNFNTGGTGSSAGNAILSDATVSTDGTLPTEAYIELVGRSNSHDIETGAVYINGWEDYSNGRLETVLRATLTEVDEGSTITSAAASGS